eukprot:3675361-Amphidinium_carterae.1
MGRAASPKNNTKRTGPSSCGTVPWRPLGQISPGSPGFNPLTGQYVTDPPTTASPLIDPLHASDPWSDHFVRSYTPAVCPTSPSVPGSGTHPMHIKASIGQLCADDFGGKVKASGAKLPRLDVKASDASKAMVQVENWLWLCSIAGCGPSGQGPNTSSGVRSAKGTQDFRCISW